MYRAGPRVGRQRPDAAAGAAQPGYDAAGAPPPGQGSGSAQAGSAYAGGYPDDDYPGGGYPGGADPGLPGPPRPPRRRRRGRVALVLALLLIGYPVALFIVAWTSVHKVPALGDSDLTDTPGRTFLVVGSDSREDLTPEQRRELGTGKAGGRRTDTIMLLHVPSGGGPTALVSIPRDSYVEIPGRGKNKINAAYAFGGPKLLAQTVEQASGVHIDDYVETGLAGFAGLVDAIGGVHMCLPKAIDDPQAHIDVPAGCQDFDGKTALGFARSRKADPRGDLARVENQRKVLAAITDKTLSPAVLLLPWRAFPAASSGGDALTVDDGTTPLGLARFVLAMRSVAGGSGVSMTVPVANANLSTPAGSAVDWDDDQAERLFEALRQDDTEMLRPMAEEQERLARR